MKRIKFIAVCGSPMFPWRPHGVTSSEEENVVFTHGRPQKPSNWRVVYGVPRVGLESFGDDMRLGSIPSMHDLQTTATLAIYSSASSKAFKTRTTAPPASQTSWRSGSLRTSRVHLSNLSG